jgi:hypothetical protein
MSNRNSSSHTGATVRAQVRVRAVYVAHDDDEDDVEIEVDLGALNGFDDDEIPLMSDSLLLLLLFPEALPRAPVAVEVDEG